MPTPRSVSNIKSKLLHPALTSHFEVSIAKPPGLTDNYLKNNNVRLDREKLNLLCSEASLPGSNLATLEINNDFTGVTERHVHRRIYDDRIDLTFYVDADNYLPIRFFETWMKYAAGENVGDAPNGGRVGSADPTYFYRVRYPNLYISKQGLTVTKFERTNTTNREENYTPKSTLQYNFVNCFPISITSMPISYDTSSLLKCTVSISYIRYYVNDTTDKNQSTEPESIFDNPQFSYGTIPSLPGLSGAGLLNTGGIPQSVVNASGNTVDRRVEAGLPYVGRNIGPLAP